MSWIYSHGGVFPVRRGFADEEGFKTAFAVLRRGGTIGMYVEGGRSRNGQVASEAKAGIGRLALESGAAVVPVAILGSHQVRNWKKLRFPKVVVRYGKPIRFERTENPRASSNNARPTRSCAASVRCTPSSSRPVPGEPPQSRARACSRSAG